ncbi:hypothetical protein JFV30_14730 [Pseudomonas sp. TH32]|uniref:hypothetical protein n=1 Tax=unclassified Pseudomonas TaxID=196821 RepID=UPI00191386E0|nr:MULTISPECIES: hypothetical protein [unclassified Pseudomonas]MBK5438027.1 hypothetical protein [Pseudomonas sp. TH32]MDF3198402.1 hypothetical protein [Pseudomonas sp. 1912-s]
MSTINTQPSAYHPSPQNALPPSGPQTGQPLNDLKALLTKDNIDQLLRNPDAQGSVNTLNRLRDLLTPANISTLLRGPDAQANAQTLMDIGELLNKDAINPGLSAATQAMEKAIDEDTQRRKTEMLFQMATDPDDDSAILKSLADWRQSAAQARQSARHSGTMANTLTDLGSRLSKHNINAGMGSS